MLINIGFAFLWPSRRVKFLAPVATRNQSRRAHLMPMQLTNRALGAMRLCALLASATIVSSCSGSGDSGTAPEPTPVPTGLTATLAWDASAPGTVSGYRVYFGTASGAYDQALGAGVAVGTASTYTVGSLTPGQTYYFAVTAVDAAGGESPYSNEASKLAQ